MGSEALQRRLALARRGVLGCGVLFAICGALSASLGFDGFPIAVLFGIIAYLSLAGAMVSLGVWIVLDSKGRS
jgi:hypothetical protein